nr:MAG TPA: hypothetical protein [Caudoviricetes sp.]
MLLFSVWSADKNHWLCRIEWALVFDFSRNYGECLKKLTSKD